MELVIITVFVLGYAAITLEHNLKVDKLIPALLMMALAWAFLAFGLDGFTSWFDSAKHHLMDGSHGTQLFSGLDHEGKLHVMENTLLHHFGKTCEILMFLVGAMTIVEIIDHFNGFSTIKKFIKTNKKTTLLWIMSILAFILSAIIDNLTATIVLITILRKLLPENKDRLWFTGLIIIAANAGGAWSPIGDVTTTMLWIGNKVSTIQLIEYLIIPSLACMIIPTLIATYLPAFKGTFVSLENSGKENSKGPLILYLGLLSIVFVPIFKTLTHLPPYVGMMFSLSIVALVAEIITARQFSMSNFSDKANNEGDGHHISPTFRALTKIEMPSILFFLGILMTVAALESLGLIFTFGQTVQASMNNDLFIVLLGVASAIIDNVPLVAASMGMYDVDNYSIDNPVWHFIAYTAGTGGSMLIIGSAAGVVAMGMERISFFWYLRNIAWLALLGYLTGVGVFLLMH